jgi:hypothetical protein
MENLVMNVGVKVKLEFQGAAFNSCRQIIVFYYCN